MRAKPTVRIAARDKALEHVLPDRTAHPARGGRRVVLDGYHKDEEAIAARYAAVVRKLA